MGDSRRFFASLATHEGALYQPQPQVWTLVGDEARVEAGKDASAAPVIDITQHGFFKLLGKGQLPQQPLVVRAKFVSKLAEKKIKSVGGAVQLVA